MTDETSRKIHSYIVEQFLFGEGGDSLTADVSLLDRGIIDSTGVLELAAYLEEEFGVKVRDDDLVPENFDTISNLSAYVARMGGAK
mgnify:CR=1 FL=1